MRKIGAPVRIALVAALVAGLGLTVSATAATSAKVLTVSGSVEQVHITGLPARAKVELLDSRSNRVATKSATDLGGLIFYKVKPATGYRVRVLPNGSLSAPITVHDDRSAPWDPQVYNQAIPKIGYGYLTTRDGTKLAYAVHPPTTPAGLGTPNVVLPDTGLPFTPPYPTLIEYSGYGYAQPSGPESGIAVLANTMGFAVVDVNMRGTGCSGGAYNFFETLQNLDGYDIIETVARQPWVKNHKVGMMGISFGAISQLFTAQTHPPSLAAISPLSTIDATATTLYPGGVLNDGFAVAWANERQQNAQPATGPGHGQAWAWDRIKNGDQTCKDNQVLHGEAQDLPKTIAENSHYNASYADTLDPITFVHKINVPTFMACQFQDEQTGGHCPDLVEHFTGTTKKWFTFTNGVHVDSLDPETFTRWYDFLQLYVNKQAPIENSALPTLAAPVIYQMAMGLPQQDVVTLPPDPIQLIPTYDAALAAFEAQPPVRILFDNGAGSGPLGLASPGDPYPGFEKSFSQFPIKGTVAKRWYLGPKGTLSETAPKGTTIDGYTSDAKALPLNDYTGGTGGGSLWGNASQWAWNWKHNPTGTAVSYVTDPMKADTGVIGAGAIHLWVRSSTPDVDLQATVSEIDGSGHETFVQNGWIRASGRKLATSPKNIFARPSTLLEPVTSLLANDVSPMPKNAFTEVVLPLYYSGHVYRQGTRIRITIAAPNGSQPIWSFSHTQPNGKANVAIAISKAMPSSLFLPVVPGVDAPTSQPGCMTLRNMPCRTYVPLANRTLAR
ncbi:MAG: peptidase [Frankiales bacterium]|nr:peptidase [Frankiales bacterium]